MTRHILVAALGVSWLAGSLHARQQPQEVPLFRTRVDLVVLDVSVLDRDRQPVRGLAAADFTVLEDGVAQTLTMFSAVDLPDPEPPAAPWMREIAPDVRRNEDDFRGQILVLVLDDANAMDAAELPLARQCARGVVDRLGPNDLAAVVFVANARAGQEFTRDRSRLLAAVERFSVPAPAQRGGVPGALEMMGPVMALRTLKGQAEALADLPTRRKAVIFISTRGTALPDAIAAGAEAMQQGEVLTSPDDPATGSDAGGMMSSALGEFGEFVRAAERANVTVYCLDPGGLRAPAAQPVSPLAGAGPTTVHVHNPNAAGVASLRVLSVNTGGFAIVDTNDPGPGLDQAFRENRSYYLLAYASTNEQRNGRFRTVRVRVNRPGAVVRSRQGYFAPERAHADAGAPSPSDASALLAAAAANAGIPLQAAAMPFAVGGRPEAGVAIVVRVEQAVSGRTAGATLQVKAYDYLAKERGAERIPVTVGLPREGVREAVEYEVLSRLDLKPGRYQLRVAAAEHAAPGDAPKNGSVYSDLDVPDFARTPLSLSGLALSAPAGILTTPKDRLTSLLPIIPTTERRFMTTDNVKAFVRVYQGGRAAPAPVEVRSSIRDAADAVVFDRAETLPPGRFSTARAADHSLDLPLAALLPGEYVLTIEATRGEAAVHRDARFSVW